MSEGNTCRFRVSGYATDVIDACEVREHSFTQRDERRRCHARVGAGNKKGCESAREGGRAGRAGARGRKIEERGIEEGK